MPTDTFYNLKPDKKRRVIDATLKELSTHPYEHVNLANIIRDSNIARGSFYQYFIDKDDLYMYFITYISEIKQSVYKDIFDLNSDISFLDRYKKLYLRGYDFFEQYPNHVKAGYYVTQSSLFKSSDLYKKSVDVGTKFFEQLINIDKERNIIRKSIDSKVLAEFLMTYMNQISIDDYLLNKESKKELERKISSIINMIKGGIENNV